jgi:hypothetical protein
MSKRKFGGDGLRLNPKELRTSISARAMFTAGLEARTACHKSAKSCIGSRTRKMP